MTSRWRALPGFLIIGAQKAGTTSLYNYLCYSPSVRRAWSKEVGYFSTDFSRGAAWYRAHFSLEARMGDKVTGEATPEYLFCSSAPMRVSTTLKNCRFIILLRDPVERALSHYKHEKRLGREHRDSEAALFEEMSNTIPEPATAQQQADPENPFYTKSYLARGQYAAQISRWFSIFPKESFLIMEASDLFDDPIGTTERALDFLELQALPSGIRLEPFNRHASAQIASTGIVEELRTYFRPHDLALADLLGSPPSWLK